MVTANTIKIVVRNTQKINVMKLIISNSKYGNIITYSSDLKNPKKSRNTSESDGDWLTRKALEHSRK